jgi:cytochrome c oxidase subunit 2
MLACLALWIASPLLGMSLPMGVSTHAGHIDALYYIILGITGFFFVLTETLLVVFMWKYAGRPHGQHVFGHHAQETKVAWTTFFKRLFRPVSALLHNQHRVELAWTLVPAAILLYIAFAQVGTWAEAKYRSRMPPVGAPEEAKFPVQVDLSARQFEWRFRYPRHETWQSWRDNAIAAKKWVKVPHVDDIHVVNELHVIKGRPVVVSVHTIDVIHSFNVPHMRVKQDTLPGKVLPVWFTPTEANCVKETAKGVTRWVDARRAVRNEDKSVKEWVKDKGHIWEIACAELCGWGHYRMVGRVYVHETAADYAEWLAHAEKAQNARTLESK